MRASRVSVSQPLAFTTPSSHLAPCLTLQAWQHPISSPSKPTRGRADSTRSPRPSATGPRRLTGSIRRRRRSRPRRTSAARAPCRLRTTAPRSIHVPARRQRGSLLPALPVRFELHVRHGAPRVACGPSPLNLCLRSPEAALKSPGDTDLVRGFSLGFGFA